MKIIQSQMVSCHTLEHHWNVVVAVMVVSHCCTDKQEAQQHTLHELTSACHSKRYCQSVSSYTAQILTTLSHCYQ